MSNIYLKVAIEKNMERFQNFDFLLKKFVTRSVLGSSN